MDAAHPITLDEEDTSIRTRASRNSINLSYAYGAPSTSTSFRPRHSQGEESEPAAVRYARLKEPDHPRTIKHSAAPKDAIKDTSVNIATAFRQATNGRTIGFLDRAGDSPKKRKKRRDSLDDDTIAKRPKKIDPDDSGIEDSCDSQPPPTVSYFLQAPASRSVSPAGPSNYRRSPSPAESIHEDFSSRYDPANVTSDLPSTNYDYAAEERLAKAIAADRAVRRRIPVGRPVSSSVVSDVDEKPDVAPQKGSIGRSLGQGLRNLILLGKSILEKGWNSRLMSNDLFKWALIGAVALYCLRHNLPYHQPAPTFTSPQEAPSNLDELVSRLTSLEQATSSLSSAFDKHQSRFDQDSSLLHSSTKNLHSLADKVAHSQDQFKQADKLIKSLADKDLASITTKLQKQIQSIDHTLHGLSADIQHDRASQSQLSDSVSSINRQIASLSQQLSTTTRDIAALKDDERIQKIALEAIEDILPSRMVARIENGKVVVDPIFWNHLRKAFSGSSSKEASSSKPLSWSDFISANEADLQSFITSDINSRAGTGAILSKSAFLDLLKKEIKSLKLSFETTANENVQKIGEEMLAKFAKQEAMLHPAKKLTVKTSDGSNVTEIIEALVDSALQKYSKDILARPDYALYSAGGRIIPSLTTPTYTIRPSTLSSRLLASVTGSGIIRGRPPVTAIHPDISVGSCWPIRGTSGQLGILLARSIIPTDITIEHASKDVALDVSSAPREFEVWAQVEGPSNLSKLSSYREAQSKLPLQDQLSSAESTSTPPSPEHILLATGVYDIDGKNHIQTFQVSKQARELEIPVNMVLLKILGNHGNDELTCLYRVRVGGVVAE